MIDPRRTATADECDLHLAIDPGTDVLLFNGLLAHLVRGGHVDRRLRRTEHVGVRGRRRRLPAADAPSVARVAAGCGLDAGRRAAFLRSVRRDDRKTVTVYSQGVNQSAHGTDKVNAIINCHLATGRIGKPGMGPFSVTGQPNAMGGREVGGLANQLAAHMGFERPDDVDRVARFWQAPDIARRAGLKAVDMFQAAGDGRIKALWIMGTNPAVSMPDADRVRAALKALRFRRRFRRHAHRHDALCRCAAARRGLGREGRHGHQFGAPHLAPEAVPARAGRGAGPTGASSATSPAAWDLPRPSRYASPAEIFREHAALSGFENDGERLFDISGLAALDDDGYDDFAPRHWPVARSRNRRDARLLGDGRFPTPDGRARFVAGAAGGHRRLPSTRPIRSRSTPAACATSGTR